MTGYTDMHIKQTHIMF